MHSVKTRFSHHGRLSTIGVTAQVVNALVDAARAGKEVRHHALRARFDEEANINLASLLQERPGRIVVYGVVGYKTHAKMILVVRRENAATCATGVHLGTGNYYDRTARLYTDFGLLTCDDGIGEDVRKVSLELTSLGRASRLKKLLQSLFSLHPELLRPGSSARSLCGAPDGRRASSPN